MLIEFCGCRKGFAKISSTHMFRTYFSLGLKQAKETTDKLLDGECFTFSLGESQDAEEVVDAFLKIGAICFAKQDEVSI
ncbi:hypothetical protein [Fibrella aestuarina]|uniref:hypothetical protein n=1 Tax=Fibrella aestuarina TaxID=651143 RepID=UPI00059D7E58|nr:hypothetical protein [Fibrella aestuarina]